MIRSLLLLLILVSTASFAKAVDQQPQVGPLDRLAKVGGADPKESQDLKDQASKIPYLRIASWDLVGFGTAGRREVDVQGLTDVISKFDIVTIQNIGSTEALELIRTTLEGSTGVSWSSAKGREPPNGVTNGFIWRVDRVDDGPEVYEKVFRHETIPLANPPLIKRFSFKSKPFVIASVSLPATAADRREAEAKALPDLFTITRDNFPEVPIFLMGMMGEGPMSSKFQGLRKISRPLLVDGATLVGVTWFLVQKGALESPHKSMT